MPSDFLNELSINMSFRGMSKDLGWSKQKVVKFKNQDYTKLKGLCKESKFEDESFTVEPGHEKNAILSHAFAGKVDEQAVDKYCGYKHDVTWLRPEEIPNCVPILVVRDGPEHASPLPVRQGSYLDDCWFISGCFVLGQFPSLWDQVVPDFNDQIVEGKKYGIYRFRFWVFGKWTEVVIDDRLPTIDNKLIYCSGSTDRTGTEFWGPLLEKAYAKLNTCYLALSWGSLPDALTDLTGGAVEWQSLRDVEKSTAAPPTEQGVSDENEDSNDENGSGNEDLVSEYSSSDSEDGACQDVDDSNQDQSSEEDHIYEDSEKDTSGQAIMISVDDENNVTVTEYSQVDDADSCTDHSLDVCAKTTATDGNGFSMEAGPSTETETVTDASNLEPERRCDVSNVEPSAIPANACVLEEPIHLQGQVVETCSPESVMTSQASTVDMPQSASHELVSDTKEVASLQEQKSGAVENALPSETPLEESVQLIGKGFADNGDDRNVADRTNGFVEGNIAQPIGEDSPLHQATNPTLSTNHSETATNVVSSEKILPQTQAKKSTSVFSFRKKKNVMEETNQLQGGVDNVNNGLAADGSFRVANADTLTMSPTTRSSTENDVEQVSVPEALPKMAENPKKSSGSFLFRTKSTKRTPKDPDEHLEGKKDPPELGLALKDEGPVEEDKDHEVSPQTDVTNPEASQTNGKPNGDGWKTLKKSTGGFLFKKKEQSASEVVETKDGAPQETNKNLGGQLTLEGISHGGSLNGSCENDNSKTNSEPKNENKQTVMSKEQKREMENLQLRIQLRRKESADSLAASKKAIELECRRILEQQLKDVEREEKEKLERDINDMKEETAENIRKAEEERERKTREEKDEIERKAREERESQDSKHEAEAADQKALMEKRMHAELRMLQNVDPAVKLIKLFDMMLHDLHFSSLICAAINDDMNTPPTHKSNGLFTKHVYAVTDLKKIGFHDVPELYEPEDGHGQQIIKEIRLIRLQNPYGKLPAQPCNTVLRPGNRSRSTSDASDNEEDTEDNSDSVEDIPPKDTVQAETISYEWNGWFSDNSPIWNKISKEKVEELGLIRDPTDGQFWMSFDDFCKEFTEIAVCRYVSNSLVGSVIRGGAKSWSEKLFDGKWGPDNCGGDFKSVRFFENPQYSFDVARCDEQVIIILSQEDARHKSNKPYQDIGFFIMRIEINRTSKVRCFKDKTNAIEGVYKQKRAVMIRRLMQPGRYCIIPTTRKPQQLTEEIPFTLRILTSCDCDARQLISLRELFPSLTAKLERGQLALGKMLSAPTSPNLVTVYVRSVEGLQKSKVKPLPGAKRSLPDPYVVVECEGETTKSHVVWNSVSPRFNIMAMFYRKSRTSVIHFKVFNHNTFKDAFMGEYTLKLSDSHQDGQHLHYICKLQTGIPSKDTGAKMKLDVTLYERLEAV
ncbi:putative Calpain-5 [Hypsibius exemplaris]|uniref:Calpain-5 n=1 Tax=Hypsibius exemplaris TaxID=2072580 RepID=A0A1W0WXP8_HYPEX|nr:putative Calpain-5 [Hypsibius exemplaris]